MNYPFVNLQYLEEMIRQVLMFLVTVRLPQKIDLFKIDLWNWFTYNAGRNST